VKVRAVTIEPFEASRWPGTDRTHLAQPNVHMMIQQRARAAQLQTNISAHSFRAAGITTYLQNGGKLEIPQQMPGHEFALTTGPNDRRNDRVALDKVERIAFERLRSTWPKPDIVVMIRKVAVIRLIDLKRSEEIVNCLRCASRRRGASQFHFCRMGRCAITPRTLPFD